MVRSLINSESFPRLLFLYFCSKSSVIYDCKHNTFLVFLSNKEAVRAMVDEAGKLPEFDILAFDAGYEHFEKLLVESRSG